MRPDRSGSALVPVVQSVISDVTLTSLGIRIPKDKFLTWIPILRKQHRQNVNVFLQLGAIGVEFARQHLSFVSDQFFILAAVGLDPAKVGALISPESVETRVTSMFVQKFQQAQGIQTPAAGVMMPPQMRQRHASGAMQVDTNPVRRRTDGHGLPDNLQDAPSDATVAEVEESSFSRRDTADMTQVGNDAIPKESTRVERTPIIRRRNPRVLGSDNK